MEVNVTLMKRGCAPETARDEIGDLDVEAHDLLRLGGVRFNKRRAALWIAGPEEVALRWRGADGQWYQCREGSERGDFNQRSDVILPKNS